MTRHAGRLLVDCLIALGATKSFGVPGESYLPVLDALHDTAGRLDYVLCRNEGGAAFMAAAYGKLTGSPGIAFVTRGPGAANAAIGVHTAMQDSVPMILFVGQVGTDMRDREAFQEVDYRAMFGALAKWVVEIDAPDRIPELVGRAFTTAVGGRPGPVVVALPEDVLRAATAAAPIAAAPALFEPAPNPDAIAATRALLAQSRRPLMIVGGANWRDDGKAALQRFAEASDLPVVVAFRYQDRFDNHSPVYVGEAGVGMPAHVKTLIRDADTILAVNVRFGEMTTDGYTLLSVPQPRQTLIHVHGSDREIGKIYVPTLGIHAGPNAFAKALAHVPLGVADANGQDHAPASDSGTTLRSLEADGGTSALVQVAGRWARWRAAARRAYEGSFDAPAQPSPVDMVAVCAFLRARLPDDVIVTNGAGNFTVWPNKFLMYGVSARLLAPQSGAMGYGLPAAIAAKVVHPDRTVVCFAGDGDFQMTCQELGTAMQAGAQPIVLVVNNGIYGTIRAHQERQYPARVSGTTLVNPDFVALARAYGFHAERVARTADFAAAFERALASPTGALLDLAVAAEALTPRQTLSQMRQTALAAQNADP